MSFKISVSKNFTKFRKRKTDSVQLFLKKGSGAGAFLQVIEEVLKMPFSHNARLLL